MAVHIHPVPHDSPAQRAAVALRRRVLREPLGLRFSAEELAAEANQEHWVAEMDAQVVACAVLAKVDASTVKLRQCAVAPEHQGEGIGRKLAAAIERAARARGIGRIVLHARETAVPFYAALGYAAEGEGFIEATIPHRRMAKTLAAR